MLHRTQVAASRSMRKLRAWNMLTSVAPVSLLTSARNLTDMKHELNNIFLSGINMPMRQPNVNPRGSFLHFQ